MFTNRLYRKRFALACNPNKVKFRVEHLHSVSMFKNDVPHVMKLKNNQVYEEEKKLPIYGIDAIK